MSETRRLPRSERRAQLIEVAASVFLDGGYDGTSMEQVAEAAGVTRLIVYRVFESKEALYRAVLASVTDRLREEWESAPGPTGISRAILTVARRHPDAFRLLWRHAAHEPPFAVEAEAFRLIVADFASGIIEPLVTDRTMRRWASTALVEHLYGGICTWLDVGDPRRDDEFAAVLQAGLRAFVDAWS
jgi:AcrR family transcriptional regulator